MSIEGSKVGSEVVSEVGSAHSTRGSSTAWNGAGRVKSMVSSTDGGVANRRSLGTGDSRTVDSRTANSPTVVWSTMTIGSAALVLRKVGQSGSNGSTMHSEDEAARGLADKLEDSASSGTTRTDSGMQYSTCTGRGSGTWQMTG